MELMTEKTFDAITVNELCERALVRRATFYKHFMDKYDFFSFFISYVRSEYMGQYTMPQNCNSLCAYCIYHFESFLTFIETNRALINNSLKSILFPVILDIFTDEIYSHILQVIKKNNLLDNLEDCSPEVFAAFYAGGIVQILQQWFKNSNSIDKNQLRRSLELLLNSFTKM